MFVLLVQINVSYPDFVQNIQFSFFYLKYLTLHALIPNENLEKLFQF